MSDTEEKMLVLKTSDDEEFQIKESTAIQSVTIKNMVEDGCASALIPLPNVDSKTLSQIIIYLNKHDSEAFNKHDSEASEASEKDLKNFDIEFFDGKSTEEIFDIILAANYLNITGLLDISCQKVADKIKNKSPEYVRKLFNINNDFTPEEEAEIREEHEWAYEGLDPDDE